MSKRIICCLTSFRSIFKIIEKYQKYQVLINTKIMNPFYQSQLLKLLFRLKQILPNCIIKFIKTFQLMKYLQRYRLCFIEILPYRQIFQKSSGGMDIFESQKVIVKSIENIEKAEKIYPEILNIGMILIKDKNFKNNPHQVGSSVRKQEFLNSNTKILMDRIESISYNLNNFLFETYRRNYEYCQITIYYSNNIIEGQQENQQKNLVQVLQLLYVISLRIENIYRKKFFNLEFLDEMCVSLQNQTEVDMLQYSYIINHNTIVSKSLFVFKISFF